MTEDSSREPSSRNTTPFTRTWIVSTAVLTVLTAVVLSQLGYIPLDSVSAAISGALVALVYISYRVAYRIWGDRKAHTRASAASRPTSFR